MTKLSLWTGVGAFFTRTDWGERSVIGAEAEAVGEAVSSSSCASLPSADNNKIELEIDVVSPH